jgi:hypothetical protein
MIRYKEKTTEELMSGPEVRRRYSSHDGKIIMWPTNHLSWSDAALERVNLERVEVPSEDEQPQ